MNERRRAEKARMQADKAVQRRAKQFLAELDELTKRYRIKIGGCGDCESPWVIPLDTKYTGPNLVDHLHYCQEHSAYGPYAEHRDC